MAGIVGRLADVRDVNPATCTGADEDVHGWLAGWIECGYCEFRHQAVLAACTFAFYDGGLRCPRCLRTQGRFLGTLPDGTEVEIITTPWFEA